MWRSRSATRMEAIWVAAYMGIGTKLARWIGSSAPTPHGPTASLSRGRRVRSQSKTLCSRTSQVLFDVDCFALWRRESGYVRKPAGGGGGWSIFLGLPIGCAPLTFVPSLKRQRIIPLGRAALGASSPFHPAARSCSPIF
jgi:hypothetical protein